VGKANPSSEQTALRGSPKPPLISNETTALVVPMEFTSFEDLWRIESNAQGPPKLYIGSLSEDRRQVLKERLRTDILGNHPDGSITLPAKLGQYAG